MSYPKALYPLGKPTTLLGYRRQLSPSAAIKVSPLCLGAMSLGDAWTDLMGSCDKKDTYTLLDHFYKAGGNFIDTANNYQDELSETWIGDWMAERDIRDQIVLATKFSTSYKRYIGEDDNSYYANHGGNNKKSLKLSLDASLKKLKTDYVDILYVHWWENTTSIEELMQSLADVVRSGKVLYLGISDTPAWIVSKANQYARDHGLPQFVVYQGKWSASERDLERDVVPMCVAEGMGLCTWATLGGGQFKTAEQRKSAEAGRSGEGAAQEKAIKVSEALEKIAKRKGTLITSVAEQYVMHKTTYVFPIVGGRKTSHLDSNIEALGLSLSEDDLLEIEAAYPFDLGFPHNMVSGVPGRHARDGEEQGFVMKPISNFDKVQERVPIRAEKHAGGK